MKDTNIDQFIKKTIRFDIQKQDTYPMSFDGDFIKLDAMESPYELPNHVMAEIANSIKKISLNRYPVSSGKPIEELKSAIRESFEIPDEAEMIFGNGSDELISLIIQSCCSPGDFIISPWPSFIYFEIAAKIHHTVLVKVSLQQDLQIDLLAMLKAIREFKPKVIFLALPNNPTGGLWSRDTVIEILNQAPGLVVLDEAYQAFTKQTWMQDIMQFDNVLILRTLSKIGFAGLRFGYLTGPAQWLEQINKVRPPYNMSTLTQTVLSTVLNHRSFINVHISAILNARNWLISSLRRLSGLYIFPTYGNFVLVRFSQEINADEIYIFLRKKNILVRNFSKYHPLLDNCLRISVGTSEDNALFIKVLEEIMLNLTN